MEKEGGLMSKKILFGTAAAAVLAMAAMATTAKAEDWTCYTYMPAPTHPVVVGVSKFAEDIEKATNDRVNVECHVGGSLPIDANSITGALQDGVIDVAANGWIFGVIPIASMFQLPGLMTSREKMDKAYEIIGPTVEEEFAKRGVVALAHYYFPEQVIWANGEVKSIADLKGKTIRVQNAEQAAFATAVGAVPVTLSAADVPPALERGTVQAVITAAAGGGKLWRDQFDHALLATTNLSVDWLQISKEKWDTLSPEEQTAVRAAAEEEAAWINNTMRDQTGELLKEFAETDKMVITEPSEADMKAIIDAAGPIWESWAAQQDQSVQDALAKVRSALAE
jgi:TRAP-type transport system periplasmic protein